MSEITLRPATPEDAPVMVDLVEIAGEGIPPFLWAGMAGPGQTARDVGLARARRSSGGFSYPNTTLAEMPGQPVGMVVAYPLAEPTDADRAEVAGLIPLLRPVGELELEAPGSLYVNILGVYDGWRSRGIGATLIAATADSARQRGLARLSVQVFSQNHRAVSFYQRQGFAFAADRPIVAHPCYPYDDRVLLMLKPV